MVCIATATGVRPDDLPCPGIADLGSRDDGYLGTDKLAETTMLTDDWHEAVVEQAFSPAYCYIMLDVKGVGNEGAVFPGKCHFPGSKGTPHGIFDCNAVGAQAVVAFKGNDLAIDWCNGICCYNIPVKVGDTLLRTQGGCHADGNRQQTISYQVPHFIITCN